MITLTSVINSAEKSFKASLESFFLSVYPEDRLVSHGLGHHQRVWEFAKELLQYNDNKENKIDQVFIQKLLIACYLHDIGMSIDTGVKHGHHSKELCTRFLREQNLDESDYEDLLSAIENHDDKEYSNTGEQALLLTILSVADDLDAFGEDGISRYIEIYKERGLENQILGKAIMGNAKNRFEHFKKNFGKYPALVEKHRKRYLVLYNNYLTTD
jgi:HD superfamily phosphodiesterase